MEQKTNEGWEKRYSNLLTPGTRIMAPTAQEAIKDFIHQELQKAREEERERIIKIAEGMKKMHKEEGTEMHEIVATAFHWFITSIKSYQSELDQPIS